MNSVRSTLGILLLSTALAASASAQDGRPVYGSGVTRGGVPMNTPNQNHGTPGPVYNSGVTRGNGPVQGGGYNNGSYNNGSYNNGYHNTPGPVYGSGVTVGGGYNGGYNNGGYNNGGYNNGQYNGQYPNNSDDCGPVVVPNVEVGSYPYGPCYISSIFTGNAMLYKVTDSYGRNWGSAYDYQQAYSIAIRAQASNACTSIVNTTGSGGGYPQQRPTYCQVMPGRNAYGQVFYRVVDRMGRIILNTTNSYEAQRAAQTDVRCFQ